MKIIIVGPAYPLRGGIAHYNALLASNLQKRHKVEIISFKRQYPKLFFPGKTQEEKGGEAPPVHSERLLDSINPLNWLRVGFDVRRRRADLIIFKYWLPFFGPCFGTVAAICRWRRNTKVLFICDNVIPHEHRPGDALFTRFAFRFVDFFIVQSHAVERDLRLLVPNARYRKVPHPIYEIFGKSITKEGARRQLGVETGRVMLFFGYVRPYKGLHLLLEAMPLILKDTDVTLYVVGEFYEDQQKYMGQIKKLGIEKNVHVVSEYVPNDRVALYFSAADVVVLPYVSATQSGVVQIAYQFDKPVIATDVGGLAEVVIDGKTGFIIPPQNSAALADAVKKYYDENRESDFVAAIKRDKAKYSWGTMVEAIETLIP